LAWSFDYSALEERILRHTVVGVYSRGAWVAFTNFIGNKMIGQIDRYRRDGTVDIEIPHPTASRYIVTVWGYELRKAAPLEILAAQI